MCVRACVCTICVLLIIRLASYTLHYTTLRVAVNGENSYPQIINKDHEFVCIYQGVMKLSLCL